MKTRIPKRNYTEQFRDGAVRQVIDVGRSASEVSGMRTMGSLLRSNAVKGFGVKITPLQITP
mgnify:CR=1 FL=1